MNPDLLQLRDIHLPDAVSWWPLAIGWWLLLAMTIVLLATLIWQLKRYRRRHFRRIGLQQLLRLQQNPQQLDPQQQLQQLSQLMRHMAILHFPESNCAGLQGDSWLQFLDRPFKDQPFSSGSGQLLATGPYQPATTVDEQQWNELIELCRRWLKKLPLAPAARHPRRQP